MSKRRIYLDHAATTPVDPAVLRAMAPYFSQKFGNPMSVHSFGQEAKEAIEKARLEVAKFLNCGSEEIIFTSGATESNNLAIRGAINAYYEKLRNRETKKLRNKVKPHIITTQFERHCVLNTCKALEENNLAEVTYLPVYKEGIVKVADVKKAIRPNTILVSIMYVNNEIGTVQPIDEVGKLIKTYNQRPTTNNRIIFHTDAVQAINYFNCDVQKLNVDLLSLSAHKIYGQEGVGALYIRKNTPISQIQSGGEQEFNLRAGTDNVPAIVGLAEAIRQLTTNDQQLTTRKILNLRNYLIKKVLKEIPRSYLNGSLKFRSPANANFRFDNVEGESIMLSLDIEGVAASTGSACNQGRSSHRMFRWRWDFATSKPMGV